jgi:TPP-dependent pyruvate/acetoin dehydrogenase alpha subunit
MKIHIPKKFKILKKVKFTARHLIDFEKKIFELYSGGKIKFPIHLSGGNEKILIKIFSFIGKNDWVFSSWRNHYHALLHGMDKNKLEKQIINGKSMYISSKKNKFFCSSIAGGSLPIALGVAKSIKLKKQKNKVWVFIGDMASEMGIFYEVYKYARYNNLPIEFVIEDNGKSVYTSTKKAWGFKKKDYYKDVIYYQYKLSYPHHGIGKWVSF